MKAAPIELRLPKRKLSPRETEVLTFAAQGKENPQIAKMLSNSPRTIEVHIAHICRKLSASNRTQAATMATVLGIIVPYTIYLDKSGDVRLAKNIRHMTDIGTDQSLLLSARRRKISRR